MTDLFNNFIYSIYIKIFSKEHDSASQFSLLVPHYIPHSNKLLTDSITVSVLNSYPNPVLLM